MTAESKTSQRGSLLAVVVPIEIPRSLATAAMVVAGIWLSDIFHWHALTCIGSATGCVVTAAILARIERPRIETAVLCLALMSVGAALWAVRNANEVGGDIGTLTAGGRIDQETAVRLTGIVSNIPALDSVVDSMPRGSASTQPPRTLFLLRTKSVLQNATAVAVRGTCRVLVEGDATGMLRWGDRVELVGQVDLASPPMNPGEFDFARHLHRSGISAMFFLKHPAAIRVIESSAWHPASWLTEFRQQTVEVLKRHLSPSNRATAEALLLGNRGHLAPDLERDFIASGTMHLLAISGLHVGILYLFLVRIFNLLLVPRTRTLLLAGTVCVMYCLLTDLRPSVSRATVFIVLHIAGQIINRETHMGPLIGATALLLVLFDPSIAFDVGAWLSFLAVGALGWVSGRSTVAEDRPVPMDVITWQDRLRELGDIIRRWLRLSNRQMLAVTMLSAPLVATQFHLVSLTGIVINILLIPFTSATLIVGYIFVVVGLVIPPLAAVPGFVFESGLSILNSVVAIAADVRFGFLTIPDLPAWFLPVYYGLLAASSLASRSVVRQAGRLLLVTLVTALLWCICQRPDVKELTCTVLSVGHGNAIVVETPDDRVLLFDAGAMNRGDRTANLISGFLWTRGHRMIDAIVISHADSDHYNALSGLLDRIPVGQILTTREFVRSDAPAVEDVVHRIASLEIPLTIVMHNDSIRLGDLNVSFLQARLDPTRMQSDNDSSLVALLDSSGRKICLPGDLEGLGQRQLLKVLPVVDLLVSPHHGSLGSNTVELGQAVRPKSVIVSARDARMAEPLERIYSSSSVIFTSLDGAVEYTVTQSGDTKLRSFRSSSVRRP